ncbi:MAG: TolC family protein [Ignavibacteriae bacterium]|nr:TolC family protein [Ignavibacteriota bacterium]MCB9242185.1 TolC family protein [Ignavibacteriales bacterium]
MKSIITILNIILLTAGISYGQSDSVFVPHGLNDLIESAVVRNSELSPVEYKRRVELTKKTQVSMQPAPNLELMTDLIPVDLEGRPRYKVILSQGIVLSDKLGESEKLVEASAKDQEITKDVIRLQLTRDIKLNYFRLYLTEKMLEYNEEYAEILQSVIKSQEINYSVGKGVQNHILKSNNELQKLELERMDLESMRRVYINNLEVLSNTTLDTSFSTQNVNLILILKAQMPDTTELIADMLTNNPEFKLIDNKILKNKIQKNLAGTERTPDLMITGGYSYNAQMYKSFIMVGLGISLPFVPWNSKRIDAKVEETELLDKQYLEEYKTTSQYLIKDMRNSLEKIRTSSERLEYIKNVLLPQTDQTFKSSLQAYVSATDDFLNLLDSYRSLREANLMLLEEQADYLMQVSDLEFIIGKQIFKIN